MRDHAPGGANGVISIVDQLERRAIARLKARAAALHVREAEVSVERFEGTKTLKETDYDEVLAELARREPSDEVRVARAKLRATRALQSCLRDDPDAGFAEWAEAIAEAPEVAFPYLVRARWRMSTDPAAALADYDRAAEIEPREPLVYWRRGDCLAAMGDQDRALANYRRAMALDPKSIDELQTMAKLLASRGEHAEAARAYDRAIALAPRYVDFFEGRAKSLEAMGDFEGAARDYGRIVEIDGTRHLARYLRASCLARAGHVARAIDEMERLIVIEPNDHHNHRTLGKLHYDAKQPREAVEQLTRALELAPDDAAAYAFRAYAHVQGGDRASALADFDHAIALEPDDPGHLLGRAVVRYPDLSPAEARADLDAILARFPDQPVALQHRAELLFRAGEWELALADYDRVLPLASDDVDVYLGRARALASLGRVEQAMEDVGRAIVLEPDNALALLLRGVYGNHLDHDPTEVEADYDRAVELAPGDASVLATRAEHLQDVEMHRAAIADYDRAIAIAPRAPSLYYQRGYSRVRIDEEMMKFEEEEDADWEEDDETRKARILEGLRDLEKAVELGLRTDDVYAEIYNAHCMLEDMPKALEALDRGLAAIPDAGLLIRFRHTLRTIMKDLDGAAADRARGEALGMKFDH